MSDEIRSTEMTQELHAFRRRGADRGWLCWVALRMADMWDWVDKRDIDKHAITGFGLYLAAKATFWGMDFANLAIAAKVPGLEIAAIIASVTAIVSMMAGVIVKFHFNARTE